MTSRGQLSACLILGLSSIAALSLAASPAGAARIHLGKPAPSGAFPGSCGGACNSFALRTAPSSPSYKVPRGRWTITSWKLQGDPTSAGEALLRIYRRTAPNTYKLIRESENEAVPAGAVTKFATHLNVRRGDRLGLETIVLGQLVYSTPKPKDMVAGLGPCAPILGDSVGMGTACPITSMGQERINVGATLKRR
jgi:hypothetical protein